MVGVGEMLAAAVVKEVVRKLSALLLASIRDPAKRIQSFEKDLKEMEMTLDSSPSRQPWLMQRSGPSTMRWPDCGSNGLRRRPTRSLICLMSSNTAAHEASCSRALVGTRSRTSG
ncbi:unnamed protein product [Urochloa humidicola]